MQELKLGSLFDGSGGFPLAGVLCGIEPIWAAEIEPFPIRVTHARFPKMKHLGSVTNVDGGKIDPVDIVTFGSPCQGLSLAGARAGIHDDDRSNLFFEAIRIIKEMREATNGKYPRFAIWENVPGAFSSNSGDDFRCVLESFCQICNVSISVPKSEKWQSAGFIHGEGFSVAWRVYDAQHFGVPQRRKRIYLVADFAGECANEILFKCEGMSGHIDKSRKAWKEIAGIARNCSERSSVDSTSNGIVGSFMGGQGPKAYSLGYAENVAPTLKHSPSGQNTVPDVVYSVNGYADYVNKPPTLRASGGDVGGAEALVVSTLSR